MYSVNVEGAYIKLYTSLLPLISRLSKNELLFYLFLTTIADQDNRFVNDDELNASMRRYFKAKDIDPPKKYTANRWLKKFVSMELCSCNKDRTRYQLRPEFVISGHEKGDQRREKLIRDNLEAPFRHQIAKYRAILLSDQEDHEKPTF